MVTAESKEPLTTDSPVTEKAPRRLSQPPRDAEPLRPSLPRSRYGPFVVMALLTAIIVFLIVVTWVKVPIKSAGSLSTTERALYVTGTTILATLIAMSSGRQVKLLWARQILHRSEADTGYPSREHIAEVRTLVGMSTLHEQLRFWSTTGALLLVGLLTTAMVAGIAPYWSQKVIPVGGLLRSGSATPCFYQSTSPSTDWFSWRLANGSYLNYNTTVRDFGDNPCPIQYVPDLFAPSKPDPDGYVYVAGAVPVSRSAVGTPFYYSIGNTGFTDAFGVFGANTKVNADDSDDNSDDYDDLDYGALDLLQSASVCSPVIAVNPVRCQKSGTLSVQHDGINVTADGCSVSSPIFLVDPTKDSATSLGVCTDGDQVGKAKIVIGSVHDHAVKLSAIMGDSKTSDIDLEVPSYTVACSIDVAPSIDLRAVQYNRVSAGSYLDYFGYSFELNSTNETCTLGQEDGPISVSSIATESTLVHGAAASYALLSENVFRDGWWNNLYLIAQKSLDQGGQLTEPVLDNSVNALEDALGLVSAGALSMYWANTLEEDPGLLWDGGTATFEGVRVGPGRGWAMVYILPELFTVGLLAYLLWKS